MADDATTNPDATVARRRRKWWRGGREYRRQKSDNVARHIAYVNHAFPSISDGNDNYFDECPDTFDKPSLETFRRRCLSSKALLLVNTARTFQKDTVKKWHPQVEDTSLTIYIGLVSIDEAASRECGVITLDLLLRAGVLVEGEDGSWELAEDWEQRRIYLFGDAKTIENMTWRTV